MSNSELPPVPGQGGRSVFTVFGFTGSHYTEDFDHPLESAPDTFNPTEVTETLRSKHRANHKTSEDATVSISTDAAHKMRLNLQDNTKLVLQSLGHAGSKATPAPQHPQPQQQSALDKHHYFRRYSNPQGEEVEDTFDTEVIHKFKSTVSDSSKALLSQHHNTQKHLYTNWSVCSKEDFLTPDNSTPASLPRRQSSPNLELPVALQRLNQSKSFCLSPSESSVDPDTHTRALTAYIGEQTADKAVANIVGQMDQDKNRPLGQRLSMDTSDAMGQLGQSDHSNTSGLGLLARTRQFGAWLTKATEGEKVKVTKKDLNVLAPNSF